jgi:hypothetical protein
MAEAPARSTRERWLPLLFLGLAFLCVLTTFRHPERLGWTYDWRLFQTWIETARRSVLWYGQFPLWNPWTCGGQVYLANPQSLTTAPTFVLPLVFGTALGLKLTLVAYLFCAFDGMYRLARQLGLALGGALLAAILFGSGGWLALHLGEGHNTFAGAALFPYLAFFYKKGVDGERLAWEWSLPLGATAAWIVAQGGTSTPAMATVLLATLGTVDLVRKRSARPLIVLGLALAVAAAVGAVRVLPALEFALDHPRPVRETDHNSIWDILRFAYVWRGVESVKGKRYWFHEYGYRLAFLTPPLILWSLKVKRHRWVWILALVGGGLVAGDAIPYGPWWLLRKLPIFTDLRVPSRYAILLAIALPLLCGAALDDLSARLQARRGERSAHRLAAAVLVVCALDGLAFHAFLFHKVFTVELAVPPSDTRFYQEMGDWSTMMQVVWRNHGAIGCDEEAPLQRAAELDLGDVPQVRLLDPAAGEVKAVRWTPNAVEADLVLAQPTTAMINTNWNEHWRASSGRVVRVGPKHPRDRDGGRLGVELPAGARTLVVRYRPRSFVLGLTVTGLALPLCAALFVWRRRRARRDQGIDGSATVSR